MVKSLQMSVTMRVRRSLDEKICCICAHRALRSSRALGVSGVVVSSKIWSTVMSSVRFCATSRAS